MVNRYAVPNNPFAVDSTVTTNELNSLINQLIEGTYSYTITFICLYCYTVHNMDFVCLENATNNFKKVEFDFLVGEQFVRTELGQHITLRGLSSETVIDMEYVERLPAPEPQDCLLHDDWVSAVHVCNDW